MNSRSAKAILLLLVVVPLGLLVAFKLGGFLDGNASISDTLNLDPVRWELERPGVPLALDPNYKAERVFENDELSIRLDATPLLYIENGPFGSYDTVSQEISANISLTRGFLRNLNIVFREKTNLARVRYQPTGGVGATMLVGLKIDSYASGYDRSELLRNGIKAFVNMSSVNRPSSVFFEDSSWWCLRGSQNQTHEMQIAFEIIHFNGTHYKRVLQPFDFRISRDNNDIFETAQKITLGYCDRLYIGKYDLHDFYKISVLEGEELSIAVNATSSPPPHV